MTLNVVELFLEKGQKKRKERGRENCFHIFMRTFISFSKLLAKVVEGKPKD